MSTPSRSTWVPADSFNYADIFSGQSKTIRRESPDRVLGSPKLLKQQKAVLNTNKKKQKRRANHYDELCMQYQHAQKWLHNRNSEMVVKLTKTELKVVFSSVHCIFFAI